MKKAVLVPLLLVVLAVGGYLVYSASNSSDDSKLSQQEAEKSIVEENKTTEQSASEQQSEEDFNNSGRAKAIEKESDLWPIFSDDELGFSVQYPQDATLLGKEDAPKDLGRIYYGIDVKNTGQQDLPWQLNEEEAQKTIESLSGGEFGMNHENLLASSKKVKSVGFLFAQDYMIFGRFDVCDVTMERKLLFFFNNKQITITAHAPISILQKTMPEYFVSDKENCGEDLRWDFDKQGELYQKLVDGKASVEAQSWFDDFDKMVETITFTHG